MRVGRGRRALVVAALLVATACGHGGTSRPPPAPGHWKLVFHDEFGGSSLDTRRWATCYDWNRHGCTNSSNHEEQWYLPGQVTVDNGALSLTAVRRPTRGSDGKTYPWTSGMISTGRDHWDGRPRRTFTYGYFESAIRIPPQAGMFPAFWMMPASRHTPPELDVMEFLGSTRQVLMSTHWRGGDGARRTERGTYGPEDFPAGYHVFALLWTRHELTWFVDGVARLRVTDPERVPNVPMEVLVDLAVGLPHSPPPSVREARMKVDWVRVWQQ